MMNTVEIQAAIQVGKVKHTFTFELTFFNTN